MRQFEYEHVSKAWATKFLANQLDSQVLVTRPQNSYGTRFCIGEFNKSRKQDISLYSIIQSL